MTHAAISVNQIDRVTTNILGLRENQSLDAIFAPHSIAVIGASKEPGSVGRAVFENLLNGPLSKRVYPVNFQHDILLGRTCYPTVLALPSPVELAIIVTPALSVPQVIEQCVQLGVKGAIVISAGFKETGTAGARLEEEVLAKARVGHLRLLGPNCLGVMRPHLGLNATFAPNLAQPGSVGFISQSGALCTAVLDWSKRENIGFSAFVSIGSMADIGWGDLIDYLGDDPLTKSIIIYMESIGDARSFLSAAREVALTKPIIVLKPGHTMAAAKAATSHTGTLAGSDAVMDAAFRRCGVLRVNTIAELFYMAEILALQPRPQGPHLTILTNAGGPGVLATDALITGGGVLAPLSEQTKEKFNQFLPSHWSHNNPVDILGDATPERYRRALEIAANDTTTDGLLVVLTPQTMTEPIKTAEYLIPYAHLNAKPVLASWMGGEQVAGGEQVLTQAGIPVFAYPDDAVQIFNQMWRYTSNLNSLYQTPRLEAGCAENDSISIQAGKLIEAVRATGRTIMTEIESKQILALYGIPIVETCLATTSQQAVALANKLGYPVVLKLNSKVITHKTDVGGVQLNLNNAVAVRKAYQAIKKAVLNKVGPEAFQGVSVQPMMPNPDGYEVIMGSSVDPQFGPVMMFGSGGQMVEVYKDTTVALPPLNSNLARCMMEQTRIYEALKGVRGRNPVDLKALEQILVRFSHLVVEQRWIKEIDLNPLLASPDNLVALDARIILQPLQLKETELPQPAIQPYPVKYEQPFTIKDGTTVIIRPIRPEDEPLMVIFHQLLSERSVYFRYLHFVDLSERTAHHYLTRMCFIDYDREMALVAEYINPITFQTEILGVGRLIKLHGTNRAELAVVVSDRWQGRGLGQELVQRLQQIAIDLGIEGLVGEIHPQNLTMQHLCKKMGFQLEYSPEERVVEVTYTLPEV